MDNMIVDYATDINHRCCSCDESDLISSILGIDLSYSHFFYLVMQFPKIEPQQINLENITKIELFIEFNFVQSQSVSISDDYNSIRKYIIKIIKRFTQNTFNNKYNSEKNLKGLFSAILLKFSQ